MPANNYFLNYISKASNCCFYNLSVLRISVALTPLKYLATVLFYFGSIIHQFHNVFED